MKPKKLKLTIEMDVTPAQAISFREMFLYCNSLSKMGSSRRICFNADGDGDFHPNCKIITSEELPELTPEELLKVRADTWGNHYYDSDFVSTLLDDKLDVK